MRPIDADKAFDRFFEMWGTEVDPEIAGMFAEVINDMPTIEPPPNDPLTLEELRGMNREAVWVEFPRCQEANGYMLVSTAREAVYDGVIGECAFENCGVTWTAYRRKPEKAQTDN